MYRLVVYELAFLLLVAFIMGFFGVFPVNPIFLVFSVAFIFSVSWIVNKIFARMFEVPSNPESTWITALILALIISPPTLWIDMQYLPLAFWASAVAIASKYILAIRKKHVFNPVAFGVAATSVVLGLSASWWIGTLPMVPFVLIGGLLIVRKIRRFDLWFAFIGVFTVGIAFYYFGRGLDVVRSLSQALLYAPTFFFATVMLTEPMTTPPSKLLRVLYGALVGLLFLPNVNIGSFYFTPELALLVGNVFSYLVSPKYKLNLKLKRVVRLSRDVYEFAFASDRPVSFRPGQYMEWTLAHSHPDSRSVRRFFTLASSPTERELSIGVKFYEPGSTFKKAMLAMSTGKSIVASEIAGDFTLPKNKNKKLVFIAGGIGVTPFRSMIQYLLHNREARPITLLYFNKTPNDAVYSDIFERAKKELGIKTVYSYSDDGVHLSPEALSALFAQTVKREVPDFLERKFYISGPQAMVTSYKAILRGIGVKRSKIKTDYFPGFV